MDPLYLLTRLNVPGLARCRVPRDLESVTSIGEEAPARDAGVTTRAIDGIWAAVRALYRTGVYPAIQICIRRHGHVIVNRAIGHARGNAPDDSPDAEKRLATPETPFTIYSAAKAITAMVIHKLDERHVLHLEDRVCEFVPEFTGRGKDRITIRHLLAHRAGIPNLPPDSLDLELLSRPDEIIRILAEMPQQTQPGRLLAYHAVSGGFVLGEVVRRVTGLDIRTVLEKEIVEPLGFRWMRYGVSPEDVPQVAHNAFAGPPAPPGIQQVLRRALGGDLRRLIELSNEPRFLTGIIPSANIVATASELAAFYQCLLDEGILEGVRVFDPRTIRHATAEQSYWELDLTLVLPLRYGLGFMLGGETWSLFGWDNPLAFGHIGFTNIFTWADPERDLVAAVLTSGKPIASLHLVRLLQFFAEVNRAFDRAPRRIRP